MEFQWRCIRALVMIRRDENSASLCGLVHSLRALLAAGTARPDFISGRLAFVVAAAVDRNLFQCGVRTRSCRAIPSGPTLRLAQIPTRRRMNALLS